MGPERIDDSFRREARCLDSLLGIHAEHEHVEDNLKVRLALIVATGTADRSDRVVAFADQVADQGRARTLPGRERVRMSLLKTKHLAPGAERASELGAENRLAEHAAARRQRDHVAITIDASDMGGAVLGVRDSWHRR